MGSSNRPATGNTGVGTDIPEKGCSTKLLLNSHINSRIKRGASYPSAANRHMADDSSDPVVAGQVSRAQLTAISKGTAASGNSSRLAIRPARSCGWVIESAGTERTDRAMAVFTQLGQIAVTRMP